MKFKIERNFLVRTEEYIDLNPKDFLYCANIEELISEVEDFINKNCEHPKAQGDQSLLYSEEIGMKYYDTWFEQNENSFYLEWQELKGLPQELC